MKIQALIAAIALTVAGGAAMAQTSSTAPAPTAGNTGTTGAASTPEATPDAATRHLGGKVMHTARHAKHHHVMRHHKHQRMSSADRDMMDSTHHMGASRTPSVDLNSGDRQHRMDQAYEDWTKHHG